MNVMTHLESSGARYDAAREIDAERDLMASMLVRGCGMSDIIERTAGAEDFPDAVVRRAQRLEMVLAEVGPLPREEGGAGKSPRKMHRTRMFMVDLIARLELEAAVSAQNGGAATNRRRRDMGWSRGGADRRGTLRRGEGRYGRNGAPAGV